MIYNFTIPASITPEQVEMLFGYEGFGDICRISHPNHKSWSDAFADRFMRLRVWTLPECEQRIVWVSHKMLQRGLRLFAKDYPAEFAAALKGDGDGWDYQRIVQLSAFGEMRFG